MKGSMGHDKQVLLVFIQADSGVDGTSLLDSASPGHNIFSVLKDSLLSNVIRRAQFAIPPLALMILSSQKKSTREQKAGVIHSTRMRCDLHLMPG